LECVCTTAQDDFSRVEPTNKGANKIMPDFQATKLLKLVAALMLLTGCEPSELRPIPIGAGGGNGGGYTAPSRSAPAQTPAVPVRPILQDPEANQPAEYDEPIIATSPEEADRICRQKAAKDGVTVARVQQPNKVQGGKSQQYRCWFKFEG
jgi:hypothetical protein